VAPVEGRQALVRVAPVRIGGRLEPTLPEFWPR